MNCIKIEFCAEDRARIDALISRFDQLIAATDARIAQTQFVLEMEYDGAAAGLAPEKEAAPAAAPAVVEFPPADDAPPFEAAPAPVVKPAVTLEQIQKKATQIAAGSADKKAALRAIVNQYAAKVTDIPEAAWSAVWDALCKLESEAV